MTFANEYEGLVGSCLDGVMEMNQRTGEKIRIARGGYSFKIDLSDNILPTCGYRFVRPKIAAAELAWCLRGETSIRWLQTQTGVWDQFADIRECLCSDGMDYGDICPNCNGTGKTMFVDQAYGYRWRLAFDRDQLGLAIAALTKDPTDRRIWISSWDPRVDGLGAQGQKTVPCPVGFTFSIVAGHLDSTLMIRSSDVYMGLPIDVMRHALLMAAVAVDLNVTPGIMQVALAHPHLYERHVDNARQMFCAEPVIPNFQMPPWTTREIADSREVYMELIKEKTKEAVWPSFDPRSNVVV